MFLERQLRNVLAAQDASNQVFAIDSGRNRNMTSLLHTTLPKFCRQTYLDSRCS